MEGERLMPIPKFVISLGLMAANMALSMTRKIEGPRLDDLKFTSGDYGAPLPMVWGLRRVNASIFWAESLREVQQESKTKGGKYNQYKYYGTWAVAVAGHEVESVSRVWFDTHLAFDLTGAGPVTPFDFGDGIKGQIREIGTNEKGKQSPYFSAYRGTETQEPDTRMQATVEAEFGEGSCPAYRGTAYIVFKDVPLEKLGNRIPQISVEFVANSASSSVPTATIPQPGDVSYIQSAVYSTDYSRLLITGASGSGTPFEIWDVAARAPIVWGELADPWTGYGIGMYASGVFLLVVDTAMDQKLISVAPDGSSTSLVKAFPDGATYGQEGVRVLRDGNGIEHWITQSTTGRIHFDGGQLDYGMSCPYAFVDAYGDIWQMMHSGSNTIFQRLVDCGQGPGWPDTIAVTLSATANAPVAVHSVTADGDRFIIGQNSESGTYCNYVFDPAIPGTVTRIDTGLSGQTTAPRIVWDNIVPGAPSYWIRGNEVSLATGEVLRTAFSSTYSNPTLYDPINHAVIEDLIGGGADELKWWFLDRVSNNGVALSTIAADLADRVGCEDYDFSDLDQTVTGWSATQGQASSILEPLLDVYDCDLRPHGFTLEGIKRTGTTAGTLLTERFVAAEPRYSVKVRQAAELPRALTVSFADIDADQQANNVRSGRPLDATGARGEKSLDLSTMAADADTARALADRYFRRVWNERTEVSLTLTAQQLALEPGDVRTLNLDGETLDARLVKLTVKADDTLATEWVYDHPSLAGLTVTVGAPFDGRDESVIVVPLISRGHVLDIPLLQDADTSASPLLYLGASPYATGAWPGATIYKQIGTEYTDELDALASSAASTWGYATEALADANPNLWDRLNSVNVRIQSGTLTGCTEADIDAQPMRNLALLGQELVNFTTATLEGDGTYTLSGFKRGRRGTEWACADHAISDVFVLLANVERNERGLSDVGTNMSFKAVTAGRSASGAFPITMAPFTGASLKPYAPCHLEAELDGSDWQLSWVRRTRIGGAWTSGTTIPLSEASEEYEIEIMDGVTVARTVTGLSSPDYLYLAADQTTDFGAPLTSAPDFRVYQISDAVGRGFMAEAA
jgi:hypothetical protein